MITKKELKQLILLNEKAEGYLQLSYLPESSIKDTEGAYSIYYGGWRQMNIGTYYSAPHSEFRDAEITEENIDKIIDSVKVF